MKTFNILIVLSFFWLAVQAQHIEYKFMINYSDAAPLANSKIIINGMSLFTDNQGIINYTFTTTTKQVDITTGDKKKYSIISDTRVLLPADNSLFIIIKVAAPNKIVAKRDLQPEIIKRLENQAEIISKIDKETKLLREQFSVKNKDETFITQGKLESFPLISSVLNDYLNEARNFNDAFLSLSVSLENKGAYEQLTNSIYSYNQIFDYLNKNKDIYQELITNYWSSKELGLKFSALADYIIEEFHRPYVLEVNYTFINRIYDYNREKNRKRKIRLKEELQASMKLHSDAIARKLTSIGERIVKINTELKN